MSFCHVSGQQTHSTLPSLWPTSKQALQNHLPRLVTADWWSQGINTAFSYFIQALIWRPGGQLIWTESFSSPFLILHSYWTKPHTSRAACTSPCTVPATPPYPTFTEESHSKEQLNLILQDLNLTRLILNCQSGYFTLWSLLSPWIPGVC